MRALAITTILCVGAGGCTSKAIGEAVAVPFRGLAQFSDDRLEARRAIDGKEAPDLTIDPGETGYITHPAAPGPQYHYWIMGGGRTFIAADVFYGDVKKREIIAEYPGFHKAGYDPSKLEREPALGRLFLAVVDRSGKPMKWTTVRIVRNEGTTDLNLGDGTDCEWFLAAGECTIQIVEPSRGSFGRPYAVTIEEYQSHEYVIGLRSLRKRD